MNARCSRSVTLCLGSVSQIEYRRFVRERGPGKVVRARITPPGQGDLLGGLIGSDLPADALRQGLKCERYGRVWYIGHLSLKDGYMSGRLGYGRTVEADLWRDEVEDFESRTVADGAASPFMIRLSDLALVFQPRKRSIRPSSFAGAMRSMLRLTTLQDWPVTSLPGERSTFQEWLQTVDTVTRIRFRVDRHSASDVPAPDVVERLLESGPDFVAIEWKTASGGIDANTPLIQELLDEALDGSGEFVAVGRSGTPTTERRWSSALGDESAQTDVELPESGELDVQILRTNLDLIDPLE